MRIIACLLLAFPAVAPDKGGLPLKPVDVTEPSQNALIAWDGKTEILYISSVLQPKEKTRLLEILPLPSEPTAELADPQVILRAAGLYNAKVQAELDRERREKAKEQLIWFALLVLIISPFVIMTVRFFRKENYFGAILAGAAGTVVFVFCSGISTGGSSQGQTVAPTKVEVLSQQQLGPHGLSIVKAKQPEEISVWIEDLIRREKGDLSAFDAAWRELLASYVRDGYPYFAVDLIDADPASGPIAPIRYTFASDAVYFPLRISSRGKGDTSINLFVVHPQGAGLQTNTQPSRFEWPFAISPAELRQIDPPLVPLFKAPISLRCIQIRKPLDELTTDFIMKPYQRQG